ncbi:MAG TPA: hypothetical protein V6C57_07120 [Coleofasciculaceae cyanobacterium]
MEHLLDELTHWTQLGLSRFQAELAGMTQANPLSSAQTLYQAALNPGYWLCYR